MVQFKVLQPFRDIKTGERYKAGEVIEMTVKRANEAKKNLKKYNGEFLTRLEEKSDE